MDYTKAPLAFKIKKVLRYCKLYGMQRACIKVQGQLHMKKTFNVLPPNHLNATSKQTVGLIGCGNYAFSNIAYYLSKMRGHVIRGVMDKDINHAASLFSKYKASYYTDNAMDLICDDAIDMLYIASNHSTHAEYAIEGLKRNKNVYIEKPHVVSEDQLNRLVDAMKCSDGKVFLGFNRPGSRLGSLVRKYMVDQEGSAMYNWFVAGHAIDPDHWYFRPEEGGRVLGNLCHWTDFIYRLSSFDMYPIEINPTRAEKSDCDIAVTYTFSDGTIAIITFSAKGHTFEGVREKFAAHKGNCMLELNDFQRLKVEIVDDVKVYKNMYRDQGHKKNIIGSYDNVRLSIPYDKKECISYIWNTGKLFLETRRALENKEKLIVYPYS